VERTETPRPSWRSAATRSLVGITCDLIEHNGSLRAAAHIKYAHAVATAGGLPVLLQPIEPLATEHALRCDAFILTGGDDPRTEPFGVPTHPKATPVHAERQAYESALIAALERTHPAKPVLGVCLGMQMMALHAGGLLDQHMPDTTPNAERHWDHEHAVAPDRPSSPVPLPAGTIFSRHRQAITDPGRMVVVARADDAVVEAVADPDRPFYLGVQWHPERTESPELGAVLFNALVAAARAGVGR